MEEEQPVSISVQDVPDPVSELRKMIKERDAVILKQNEAIKSLTDRMNDFEKLASAAPAQAPVVQAPEQNPQDAAYDAMLREMGIVKEE